MTGEEAPSPAEIIDPELVDFAVLGAWMDEHGLPAGPFESVEELTGGTQNTLVRFARGGRGYVLRRPPRHLRRSSNEVLRREARVLAALARTAVPHPGLIAACPDESVMGAVFYLMEPVDGFNPSVGLPELHASDAALRRAMGFEVADAIAALGALDHEALGLADLGRPEGFLERQVDRWLAELDGYGRLEGYPGPELPGLDRVAAWLEVNRPPTWSPGIMHGDYHLANVMYSHTGPELVAIVDWEMCTIGDPLLDLGWMLSLWPDPDHPVLVAGAAAELGGFPTRDELVARYAERSTRDTSAIDFYRTLACFKLGIILEGTNARAHAGQAPKDTGDLLHAIAVSLFDQALRII